MPTLIPDPLPAEVQALIDRRHEWGSDRHDEVWEGVLHMSPPPSGRHEVLVHRLALILDPFATARGLVILGAAGIGVVHDHRVPDLTLLRAPGRRQWQPTAALAVEVLSWRDPAHEKLDFYAAHRVEEIAILDPTRRSVEWLALGAEGYAPVERSAVIELSAAELAARLDWDTSSAVDEEA